MQLHRVLSCYDVTEFSLADETHAYMLLHHVAAQCHRPNCVTDALSLVEAYSCLHPHLARSVCVQNLVEAPPCVDELPYPGSSPGTEPGLTPSSGVVSEWLLAVAHARAEKVLAWLQCNGATGYDQLAVGREVLQACVDALEAFVEDATAGALESSVPVADAMAAMERALRTAQAQASDRRADEDDGACLEAVCVCVWSVVCGL